MSYLLEDAGMLRRKRVHFFNCWPMVAYSQSPSQPRNHGMTLPDQVSERGKLLDVGRIDGKFFCKGSLCFREITSRPALIPFCPQDFPFRFPVWRVHAPRHPPPQKFFCILLYISIAHVSHNICHFCASERTIHCECFALHSRALVFATRRFLLLLLSRASRHHVLTY